MSERDHVALSGVTHRATVIRASVVGRSRALGDLHDKVQCLLADNMGAGDEFDFDTSTLRNVRSDVEHCMQLLDEAVRRLDRVADASQAIYHLWREAR